jgi:hypothetical protein
MFQKLSMLFIFALCAAATAQNSYLMVSDSSASVLQKPSGINETQAVMATVPPRMDFAIVQVSSYGSGAPWGGWGENNQGPNGKFYFNIGNHQGVGANALFCEYDPLTKKHKVLFDTKTVCGWGNNIFADGKLHGTPDVAPNGDVWMLTFYGPEPNWSTYQGGHLVHYNINTNQPEHLGIPDKDGSWPECVWDWQRDRLYGVSEGSGDHGQRVLVYDTKNRKLIFSGKPKAADGTLLNWYDRSDMLDRETGIFYASEASSQFRMLKYDPVTNTFSRMQSTLRESLRSWTDREKCADGRIPIFDQVGNFYYFSPQQDKVEYVGKNWGTGEYVCTMRLSPGKRYLYYVVSSTDCDQNFPVVQYDLRANKKKVLAYLRPFYMSKYNYGMHSTYSLSISSDGASLFIQCNGNIGSVEYGAPSILHFHIPLAERSEDSMPTSVANNFAQSKAGAHKGLTKCMVSRGGVAIVGAEQMIYSIQGRAISQHAPALLKTGAREFRAR